MNKNYISLSGLSVFYSKIKEWINSTFAEKFHPHEIADINGLQRRLDELTLPPDIETSDDVVVWVNQLSVAVNDLTSTVSNLTNTINSLIPAIGEIYITTSNENPSVKFGGVWEQIKDVFLLAAGDTYSAGSIGGEAAHFLTIDEMPSHTHAYKRHEFNRTDTDPDTGEDVYGANNKTLGARMGSTEATGNGQVHTNSKKIDYVAVPEELRLGCYRSNVGGTGRFAKGILNDCKIYNYALSDEQVRELLVS